MQELRDRVLDVVVADERITRYGFPDSRDNEFHELRARDGKIALDGSLIPDG